MKKVLVFIIALFFVLPVFSQSQIADNELILFMDPGATPADLIDLLEDINMEVVEGPTPNLGALLVRFPKDFVMPTGGNPLGPVTGRKIEAQTNPDTDGVSFNYVLANNQPLPSSAERCTDILDPTTQPNGGNSVVTAIFDTGISPYARTQATSHFVPSDMGYNAIKPVFFPRDGNGHGTHIASILMDNLENANGAIQIKAYKTHGSRGSGSLFDVIKALDYAVTDGVDIINMSFVYNEESQHGVEPKNAFKTALERAFAISEMLIVTAAGNDDQDNDFTDQLTGLSAFPASFDYPYILSVASSNCTIEKSTFSNYGVNSVDVYAPGENIEGRNHRWNPVTMDGTSQATAFVTKLATYLGSHQASFSWEATKCAILNSTTPINTQPAYTLTNGYINSVAALDYLHNNSGTCEDATYWEEEATEETNLQKTVTYLSNSAIPTFEITVDKEEEALISIININGQILVNEQVQLTKGHNIYTCDFPKTGSIGLYFMMIQTKDGKQTLKFIK